MISDMDLKFGESSYYPDIDSFLNSIVITECIKEMECSGQSKINSFDNSIFND